MNENSVIGTMIGLCFLDVTTKNTHGFLQNFNGQNNVPRLQNIQMECWPFEIVSNEVPEGNSSKKLRSYLALPPWFSLWQYRSLNTTRFVDNVALFAQVI